MADTQGNIWIGTRGGLAKFDGQHWSVYSTTNSGLPNDDIRSLVIDQSGNVWVGTYGGGLAKFDGRSWSVYNTSNSGLPDNFIKSLAVDSHGNIYIGTLSSLTVYHNSPPSQ